MPSTSNQMRGGLMAIFGHFNFIGPYYLRAIMNFDKEYNSKFNMPLQYFYLPNPLHQKTKTKTKHKTSYKHNVVSAPKKNYMLIELCLNWI